MSQLSEVSADRVEDSQQDVDVEGVKLSGIRRMSVLRQNLLQLNYKHTKIPTSLTSQKNRTLMVFLAEHTFGRCVSTCRESMKNTFTVVGEMEQERLETACVRSERVPDYFTEQDDGNIVLHLQRRRTRQQTAH